MPLATRGRAGLSPDASALAHRDDGLRNPTNGGSPPAPEIMEVADFTNAGPRRLRLRQAIFGRV